MDPRTESIKQEVEETLEDMAAKMEQIEERVVGTARETVEQVKEKLDVRHMVAERPWTMLGVSVAAGFVVGSIRRSGGRDEDSDGRALRAGSLRRAVGSRAFQYEHSEDPYRHAENDELGSGLLQGVGEGMRQGLSQEAARRSGEDFEERTGEYRARGMGHERGMGYEQEHAHRSRKLVQRSISKVKERAPGFLAALRENFGDEIEALKRAVVVAAGNSLRGIMLNKMPQLAEEFDRARQEAGQHRGESGGRGEQRRQTWQGQGGVGQGSESDEASEGRYGTGGQTRYNPEASSMGSSGESEGSSRTRGNEPYGAEGGPGPSGRKSHN